MSEELIQERSKLSFRPQDMTDLLAGGRENTLKRQKLRALVEADPVFRNDDRFFLSHAEKYKRAVDKGVRLEQLTRELNLSEEEAIIMKTYANESLPFSLHDVAFLPALQSQCSDEQKQKWLKAAERREILGCYAQTELSHGSNVRGLQTTATYLPSSDEIELHTPSLGATKWWPGLLGKTATHAIVHARLRLPKKGTSEVVDYGVHPFFVRIRDRETLRPLPGIIIGDIGPKMGYNGTDNGFMQFNRVRIPRDNILGKTGSITPEGEYVKPDKANLRAMYSGMTYIRSLLVMGASNGLARAVTIAVRYLLVRRQFCAEVGGPEQQVLDYMGVQYRIFPLVATAYALAFTGRLMEKQFRAYSTSGAAGRSKAALAELHATSSGLKSHCTTLAADGIETCRRACGGHGYSELSGLPECFKDYVAVVTAEGDNFLLKQQTARHLLKSLQAAQSSGKVEGTCSYLQSYNAILTSQCAVKRPEDWLSKENQAFNALGWEIIRCSDAHCRVVMLQACHEQLAEMGESHPLHGAVKRLSDLFGLFTIEQSLGEILQDGYTTGQQASWLRDMVRASILSLRPDILGYVDSFDLSDFYLNSALGQHQGRPYETLFQWAQREPLNREKVSPALSSVQRLFKEAEQYSQQEKRIGQAKL